MWKKLKTKLFGPISPRNRFRIDYQVRYLDHLGCYVVWDEGEIKHFTHNEDPNKDQVIQEIRSHCTSADRINQIMNSRNMASATLNYVYNYTKENRE